MRPEALEWMREPSGNVTCHHMPTVFEHGTPSVQVLEGFVNVYAMTSSVSQMYRTRSW